MGASREGAGGGAGAEQGSTPAEQRSANRQRRYSAEERAAVLAAYRESGLTIAEFCATVEPSEDTLYRWLRKEREHGRGGKHRGRRSDGRVPHVRVR